jgi:hypothetical protein
MTTSPTYPHDPRNRLVRALLAFGAFTEAELFRDPVLFNTLESCVQQGLFDPVLVLAAMLRNTLTSKQELQGNFEKRIENHVTPLVIKVAPKEVEGCSPNDAAFDPTRDYGAATVTLDRALLAEAHDHAMRSSRAAECWREQTDRAAKTIAKFVLRQGAMRHEIDEAIDTMRELLRRKGGDHVVEIPELVNAIGGSLALPIRARRTVFEWLRELEQAV